MSIDPAFMAVTHEEVTGPVPADMAAITAGIRQEMAESITDRNAINDANAAALGVPTLRHGDVPGM